MSNTSLPHTIHNTLIEAGWTPKNVNISTSVRSNTSVSSNKYVYIHKDPYDEFILEYISPKDILITVPIPFRGSSMAYQKTFSTDNMAIILNYLQIHLGNYK